MKLPLVLVNFKCYKEATGKNALRLAKICEKVASSYKINIAISPQFTDLYLARKVNIPVFAQHVDFIEHGAYTGHVSPLALKEAGVKGSLINHSERKLRLEEIEKCVELLRKYKLISVVCADSLEKGKAIANFKPDFIAYEDPVLIGSGNAISKVKPDSVKEFVEEIYKIDREIKILCGAGITSGEDVKKALELGTEGVLVASGIVKAKNPRKALEEFAKAVR
ncbi:MAG: triose-phosphate isomerase [Candidatus Aenigmatarchaeota archaeon]